MWILRGVFQIRLQQLPGLEQVMPLYLVACTRASSVDWAGRDTASAETHRNWGWEHAAPALAETGLGISGVGCTRPCYYSHRYS